MKLAGGCCYYQGVGQGFLWDTGPAPSGPARQPGDRSAGQVHVGLDDAPGLAVAVDEGDQAAGVAQGPDEFAVAGEALAVDRYQGIAALQAEDVGRAVRHDG